MRWPIFSVLSLGVPIVAIVAGYFMVKGAKGATNLGEALGPWLGWALIVVLALVAGEVMGLVGLMRAEKWAWLTWMGVLGNGVLLLAMVCFAVMR